MLVVASVGVVNVLVLAALGLLFLSLILGGIFVLIRGLVRAVRGPRTAPTGATPPVQVGDVAETLGDAGRVGAVIGWIGAALVVVAVFLPRVTAPFPISNNSLIQSGDGWLFVVIAVGVSLDCYRVRERHQPTAWVLIGGAFVIADAIYSGTGSRLTLTVTSTTGLFNSVTRQGHVGIGIYMAGIGGAIVALGGATLMGWDVGLGATAAVRARRQCPDCAETVLADANVCKHCGYRFDGNQVGAEM